MCHRGGATSRVDIGGEDYELLFTLPESAISAIDRTVRYSVIGRVIGGGVLLDEDELPDRGYDH